MEIERSSGILVHISSLPSSYGIGDLGPEAYKFIDFLHETRQKIWQILPLTPTNSPSPYSGISAFGGHSWLISPEKLIESNLLSKNDLKSIDQSKFHDDYVSYQTVKNAKEELFKKAHDNFKNNDQEAEEKLKRFFEEQRYWIDDFTLFMTIKEQYTNGTWADWPDALRRRQPFALEQIREMHKDRIEYYLFVQYVFHQQWFQLKKYAKDRCIKIVGDMPIYVDYDSVDVWAHADLFQLDHENTMKQTVTAGFPPAHGSSKVQLWNMPIYNWNDENVKPRLFQWWIERLRHALTAVDILRIDHFRGLESHYVIPVDISTQKPKTSDACWVKTPGDEFFTAVTDALGNDIPLIVEDIGDVTSEVFELRDRFKLHGIRIIQKGFYFGPDNMYAPHNFIPRSIAYTGTHDHPTTLQWWTKEASSKEKSQFIDYIRRPIGGQNESIDGLTLEKHVDKHICWYCIQLVMQSASNAVIIQMQDILNVGTRMNEPGSPSDLNYDGPQNWSWRFQWAELTSDIRTRLKTLTQMYGRDLKHGKSIPPDDMAMQDHSKCLIQ